MRSYAVAEFGTPGTIIDRPVPQPDEGQILVHVQAAGVNAMDPILASGVARGFLEHRLPLTPGIEYAGVVAAVGPGVTDVAVGDAVFGAVGKPYFGDGSWAEYVTAAAGLAAPLPAGLDPTRAAALPTAGGTALALLDAVDLEPGDTVAIVGSGGGVGSFAVQLAARAGLRVVAVTNGAKADYVRGLGAADVIDYTAGDITDQLRARYPDGVGGIIDNHHDVDGLLALAPAVRAGGRIASPRAQGAAEAFAGLPVSALAVQAATDRAGELGALAASGDLQVPVQTMPLEDASQALDNQTAGNVRGKQVLVVDAS
jgi:NADPH:quinone reductase-like Zn-dependent oxidoreductase